MIRQLIVGLFCEGPTDHRFLQNIIRRTLEDIALTESTVDLEILGVERILVDKGTYVEEVVRAARKGFRELGIMILCIHADSDNLTDTRTFQFKILPAIEAVDEINDAICNSLIPIVPVAMTESWMIADREVLKREIGTKMSDDDLGLNNRIKGVRNPKAVIRAAITSAYSHKSKRSQRPTISELYLPLGQKTRLDILLKLESYQKFREGIREQFRMKNIILSK